MACCGPALPGMELAIWADDCTPLPCGDVGEVVVRGESVFDGYWRDPVATAETLVGGWLRTGDLGRLDAEGNLYVSGRKRAIIKRAGQLIPARAVGRWWTRSRACAARPPWVSRGGAGAEDSSWWGGGLW